jgi:copper homeostasis protein
VILEVIVQTIEDAQEATAGGADRLEVVRDILQGGLTPSIALVRDIQQATTLPLRVMVRENAGYTTDTAELATLQRAAHELWSLGVDGLVIGFAEHGRLRLDDVHAATGRAPGARITFHRAFDSLAAPEEALPLLAADPAIDRILTSGGGGTAEERSARLGRWRRRLASLRQGVTIIAGGGVDEEALRVLAREQSVSEAHVGRAARQDDDPNGPVREARVRHLKSIILSPTS